MLNADTAIARALSLLEKLTEEHFQCRPLGEKYNVDVSRAPGQRHLTFRIDKLEVVGFDETIASPVFRSWCGGFDISATTEYIGEQFVVMTDRPPQEVRLCEVFYHTVILPTDDQKSRAEELLRKVLHQPKMSDEEMKALAAKIRLPNSRTCMVSKEEINELDNKKQESWRDRAPMI